MPLIPSLSYCNDPLQTLLLVQPLLFMRIKLSPFALVVLLVILLGNASAQNENRTKNTEKLSLNKGWRFYAGDIPFPVIKGHTESYLNAKAGRASGAAAPSFNDRTWRTLSLPHDWAIENTVDSTENVSQGYHKRGIGWYRRYLKLNADDRGKHLELQFEGVATHCTVWVNGTLVHRNWSGYTSFYIDITAFAKFGDEINTIAVRVDAVPQEGWWYEGAGIYRGAWLVKRSPVHIITDGVYANPVKNNKGGWDISAEVSVENSGNQTEPAEVEMRVLDKNGREVAHGKSAVTINALHTVPVSLQLSVKNPELWSIENPILYQVVTFVKKGKVLQDSLQTYCGFRTARFDADKGFFLNDQHVEIKGVCNHQDHAGVGVAMPTSILEFRLRKLKEMGVNAYRCSHNAPAKELLDLCDKLGIMVMDENRNFNASPEYIRQLEWMVRRDRNHPSIILWSVFNEEPMQGTESGYEMVRRMRAVVRNLDSSRPVTAAMNGGFFTPINVSQAVDVVGFNYQISSYDAFHKANPTLPLTSSEDASAVMVRGEYVTDLSKNILDAYDTQKPAWGATHRDAWKAIAERPYLAGAFVWTGFDYHGEPTPFTWPTVSSNFGIMDICGFPKTAYYIHRALWVENENVIYIAPHWNWPVDTIGKPIKVMVISNAETLKLFLNGKLIGEQKANKYDMNSWDVPYEPGKLEAVGYKNGKEITRYSVETTGVPISLNLVANRSFMLANGVDALPITVEALDANGRHVPTANIPIEFSLLGNGNIIGLGNGDPNSHEPEKGNKRSLFNGLAQIIVQADELEKEGFITLVAKANGLKPFTLNIPTKPQHLITYVPVTAPSLILENWLLSAMTDKKPDPNIKIEDNDMNSWEPVTPGKPLIMKGRYVMYRTILKPQANPLNGATEIVFKNVCGKATIWADGQMIQEKLTAETADVKIKLQTYKIQQSITVLIEKSDDSTSGLMGVVEVF